MNHHIDAESIIRAAKMAPGRNPRPKPPSVLNPSPTGGHASIWSVMWHTHGQWPELIFWDLHCPSNDQLERSADPTSQRRQATWRQLRDTRSCSVDADPPCHRVTRPCGSWPSCISRGGPARATELAKKSSNGLWGLQAAFSSSKPLLAWFF